MTPKQHFRALQIRLEIAEYGMGMPLDRERVKELREQVEQARTALDDAEFREEVELECEFREQVEQARKDAELDEVQS
jgi:hypothetical protein